MLINVNKLILSTSMFPLILTGNETTEEYLDKDVAKVEDVVSLLGNEADSHIGNSALEAQGEVQ